MSEDPNAHYNEHILRNTHDGEVVANMLADLGRYFTREGSTNEMVDELRTLYHLTGKMNLSQRNFLEKLHRRFC